MKNLSLVSAVLMPFLTMAHAGHGHVQHGIGHYLTSPIHLFGVVAIAAFAIVMYKVRSKKNRNA